MEAARAKMAAQLEANTSMLSELQTSWEEKLRTAAQEQAEHAHVAIEWQHATDCMRHTPHATWAS